MNIDFHTHILPGLDHGCDNVYDSIEYLSIAKKMGVDIVISTSHFYPHQHRVNDFLAARDRAYRGLRNKINRSNLPKIILGAEVLLCNNLHKMDKLDKLCIKGTNTLLVEMPFGKWDEDIYYTLCKLIKDKRFHIVMAHIDRYEISDVKKIIEMGVDVQINADYIHRYKKRKIVKMCMDAGIIVAIGSDIHRDKNKLDDYKRVLNNLNDIDDIMKKASNLIGGKVCTK